MVAKDWSIKIKIIKQVVRNKNKEQEVQDGIYDIKFPHERVKINVSKIRDKI